MCGFICRKWSYAIGESGIVVFFCRLDYTVTICDSFYRGIAKYLTGKLSERNILIGRLLSANFTLLLFYMHLSFSW